MSAGYRKSRAGVAGDFSARIDALFARWDRDRSPGALVAVCRGGELLHQRGYGVADVENDVPFTADTVLRLGSTTKHMCATCILILENRGLLAVDDDVRRYVPELPDYGTPITLRHLMTMTSGLWDGLNLLLFAGLESGASVSRDQLARLLGAQRELMFRPGDDWTYSNTNYSLLTLVIERVSGSSLADFMNTELFRPLGMSRTSLVPQMKQVVPGKARGYVPAGDGVVEAACMRIELDGAGGVDSTISDMRKWLANYRDDRRFGPDYRRRLEAESRLSDGRLLDYRCGIEVKDHRGLQVVRHAGGMPGYLCDLAFFPVADLGIVMFTNLLEPDMLKLPNAIADIVLERELREPRAARRVDATGPDAAALIGVYASARDGEIVELAERDGELVGYLLGELTPLREHDGWLRSERGPLAVRAVAGEAGRALELSRGTRPPVRLERVDDPRVGPGVPAEAPGAYTGRYLNERLAEVHEVSFRDGRLRVDIPSPSRDLLWGELTPVAGDLFVGLLADEPSCTNVTVRFLRDAAGTVTALAYSVNRCRDVVFRRVSGADHR